MPSWSEAKSWRRLILILGLIVLLIGYALIDPATTVWAPKCPFKLLTGLDCPGCGSQRALHALLTGDLRAAWRAHPLLVVALPYLGVGLVLEYLRRRSPRVQRLSDIWYGNRAAMVSIGIIFAFWTLRLIPQLLSR